MTIQLTLLVTVAMLSTAAAQIREASPEQLRRWLRQYPEADANHDGELKVDEAEAYRRKIEKAEPQDAPARAEVRRGYVFATMSDGVKIGLAVGYPQGFRRGCSRCATGCTLGTRQKCTRRVGPTQT